MWNLATDLTKHAPSRAVLVPSRRSEDQNSECGQTPISKIARTASAILEWISLADAHTVADLAVSSLGATLSFDGNRHHIALYGVQFETFNDLEHVLSGWCGHVLRNLEQLNGIDPLVTYLQAFGSFSPEKFHAITYQAAKLGAGSWIDPTVPAQRITSHFYEIEMFGILGRGDSEYSAIDNWRTAALTELPTRIELALQAIAA